MESVTLIKNEMTIQNLEKVEAIIQVKKEDNYKWIKSIK
jgi:hypothetical protein